MADADEPDESGGDLFDRWLSHRQESADATPRPRTYAVPRTGLVGEEPSADDDAGDQADEDEPTGSSAEGPADEQPEQALAAEPAALPGAGRPDDRLPAPGPEAAGRPAEADLPVGQTGADDRAADPTRAWSDLETTVPRTADPDAADAGAGATSSDPVDPDQVREAFSKAAGAPAADPTADERFRTPEPAEAPPGPEPRREPVGLDDFEPVVIASVRRSAEAPPEKRSRLARFRRPGSPDEPADAEESPDDPDVDTDIDGLPAAGDPDPLHPDPLHPDPLHPDPLHPDPLDPGPGSVPEQHAPPPPAGPEVPAPVRDAAAEVFAAFNPGVATPGPEPSADLEPEPPAAAPPVARPPTTTESHTPSRPSTATHPTDPQPPAALEPTPPADTPAPQQQPAPEDGPPARDAAAEVFAAFNPGATTTDGSPTPAAPSAPAPSAAPGTPALGAAPSGARRSESPAARRHAAEPAARRRPRLPSVASYVEAARTTLDRSVRGTPDERAATTDPLPGHAAAAPAPSQPRTTTEPERDPALERSAYDELRDQREAAAPPPPDVLPPDIDFRPRTLARRVTSALLVVGLAATGLAAYRAYDSRVETDIGLAAILALVTGIVWAVRAGSVPTRVGLHGGVLEVRTQAGRFVFEVMSPHTRLETVGTPGRRGWKLLVHRRGLAPFVVTTAMVDGRALTEALRYYRPDL